ncbi:glycosyltransferase [Limosilactobacillus sp.]|uniref:glycosyltransferase n=1 Tax=Limosilactobacillus sp. TaxID=2773925 RepID=UPI00345F0588
MIYFINFNLSEQKSGIEHTELKRIKLFKAHHVPAKIITREWSATFHQVVAQSGLSSDDVLSMFDYYQDREKEETKHLTIDDLDLGYPNVNVQEEKVNNRYLVNAPDGHFLCRVNYDANDDKRVISTEMFDCFGNLYCVNNYDSRGFKSEIDWYSPDNKVERKEWIGKNGQVVIQQFFQFDIHGQLGETGWMLRDREGKVFTFNTLRELFQKFLDDVNAQGKNIFVLDRSLLADDVILALKRPAYLVFHLHNSQGADAQDEMHSVLNDNYEYGLYNIDRYDAIISATPNQTEDVRRRFNPQHAHLFTIPVGIVPDEQLQAPRVPESKRTFGKVIIAARISTEKQMPKIVHAIAKVHRRVPEVTFDIWGYTNSTKEKEAIKQAAQNGGIADAVTIKGYSEDIGRVYDDAQIFALASTMEGFNLAIMEASSHGVVGVTYDTNYGPNSIIENGKNGYVVPYNDEDAMADRITKLLKEPELLQQMSNNAYQMSNRYSSDSVWQAWQKLLDDAKKQLGED